MYEYLVQRVFLWGFDVALHVDGYSDVGSEESAGWKQQ